MLELPACATPFSVKNERLTELEVFQLCGLLPTTEKDANAAGCARDKLKLSHLKLLNLLVKYRVTMVV